MAVAPVIKPYLHVALDAAEAINTGAKTTIKPGEVINYTNLPNQPIALIIYNNSGDNTEVLVGYSNVTKIRLASVSEPGLSMGQAFLLNPAKIKKNEIAISIPHSEQKDATVDVYCVSLLLPTDTRGINNFEMSGDPHYLQGYSRAYASPQLAWYNLCVEMENYGFLGVFFQGEKVEIIGVNINTSEDVIKHIKSKIFCAPELNGIDEQKVSYNLSTSSRYEKIFYGDTSQMVLASLSSVKTLAHCSVSLERL